MPSPLLVASALAALLVGPLFALVWSRGRAWRAIIDGLSLSLVGGVCLLISIPHGLELAGPWALGAAILGARTPGWTHRLSARWERTFGYAGLVLLAAHAMVDGAALTMNDGAIGIAVVAHRLPMGLAVYSAATRSSSSARHGFAAVGILVIATVVGVLLSSPLSGYGSSSGHGLFEAFVAGLLLHIVFEHAPVFPAPESADLLGHGHHHGPDGHAHDHQHAHHHEHSTAWEAARAGGSRWSALGAFLGIGFVLAILSTSGESHGHMHEDHGPEFLDVVTALLRASTPPLALGYGLAMAWSAFVPTRSLHSLQNGTAASQALRGLALALTDRICACSIVPAHKRLVRNGAPHAAAMAFLVGGPALDVTSTVVSGSMLGPSLTGIRVGAVLAMALLAGLWFQRTHTQPDRLDLARPHQTLPARVRSGVRFTLDDLIDHTFPWVAMGMILAGYGALVIPESGLHQLPDLVQVPILAMVGLPAYVCATAATPAAVSLMSSGLAPGAMVALLVAGPALNLPALATVRQLLGASAARQLVVLVLTVSILAGVLVAVAQIPLSPPSSEPLPSWLERASFAVVAMMAARSMLRQGARGLVAQIVEPIEIRGVHAHH